MDQIPGVAFMAAPAIASWSACPSFFVWSAYAAANAANGPVEGRAGPEVGGDDDEVA